MRQSILESSAIRLAHRSPTGKTCPSWGQHNWGGAYVRACWQGEVPVQAFACLWKVGLNVNGKTESPHRKGLS